MNHLAIIMDGNRRWAKNKGLLPWAGHKQGIQTVRQVIEFSLENNIKIVSLYTLSLENLKRSQEEINFLFSLIIEQSTESLPDLIKQEVSIKFLGDNSLWSNDVKSAIARLENSTDHLNKLRLNILFCYGGQQEIVAATKAIAFDLVNNNLELNKIDNDLFENYLFIKKPFPDLIIRTGGQHRLSNFMLYQAAYSELYFTDKLWPDLTKDDFKDAIESYQTRIRNYGT